MVDWNPIIPPGFLIEVTSDFQFVRFIIEPPNNRLTFDEVVAINSAVPPPTPENLTEIEVTRRVNDDFARSNNIVITDR